MLIPLFRQEDHWHLVFTRRTEHVENHKGQVSFPGGAADDGDGDAVQTALRETFEEIGIPPDCVRVLGQMAPMATVTGFCITPVVGVVCWPYALKPAEVEVQRVFTVPLAWLADPNHRSMRPHTRRDGSTDLVVFFDRYDDELIWGVTGTITVEFIRLLLEG